MRPAADRRTTWRQLLRSPALSAWCVFVFVQPFYVFRAGLPQPGDLLLFPLLLLAFHGWNGRLGRHGHAALKALVWFTVWVALVDYAWVLLRWNFSLSSKESAILFPLYYIYNLIVVFIALVLHQRHGDMFLRITTYTVLAVVMMLVASSFVLPSSSLRGSLFFANPNQLGYHALLSACVIALTHRRVGIGTLTAGLGLTGCVYLAVLSASRSSVAGIAFLVVLITFSNLRVILLASVAAILVLQLGGPLARGIEASQQRAFTHRQAHLSFFEQRGYDRILNNKQYLLLGAGEGATNRFKESTAIGAAEIHSSAAMILFCYGLVGVLLFAVFVRRVLQGAGLRASLMLVPPLLYTFAHQGLRFSMLWVLVAVFLAIKTSSQLAPIQVRRSQRPRRATTPAPIAEPS